MRITLGPPTFLNVDNVVSLAYLSMLPSYLKLRIPYREKIFSTKSNMDVPANLGELYFTNWHQMGAYIGNNKLPCRQWSPTDSRDLRGPTFSC